MRLPAAHTQGGIGGCMFVSGVPGTGKTATIRNVARMLVEEVRTYRIAGILTHAERQERASPF